MKNIPLLFFLVFLTVISIGFFYLISPFFIAVFLAFVTAHFFRRPYKYFLERFKKRVAALITLLIISLVVILPIATVVTLISYEAQKNYTTVQGVVLESIVQVEQEIEKNSVVMLIRDNVFLNTLVGDFFNEKSIESFKENFRDYFLTATNYIFSVLKDVFLDLTTIFFNFLIMLYLVYFLLQEGKIFTDYLKSFIPFKEEDSDQFIRETVKVIDATIIGTIFVGIIEGVWGGVIFSLLDIPSAITWGLIMSVLSMLPVVGTNGVLVPVAVYQLITGNYLGGILVLIIGCGGILINQNIIKPKLVGNRSGVHPAILILSSLGGITLLGMIGFIIGPIIATLFIVLWKQFRNKFSNLQSLEN